MLNSSLNGRNQAILNYVSTYEIVHFAGLDGRNLIDSIDFIEHLLRLLFGR
jgi:hypothetical protein